MPTNPNMVAIQTVTVGAGGASSISFTSIPQTYTDLVVRTSYRTNAADIYDQLRLTFNGSSTAVYSFRGITGAGSGTPGSESSSSVSSIKVAPGVGNSATASTFTNDEIYIPNYTSSNNKSLSSNAVGENNATTAYASMFAGLWSNTAAITQITLVPESAGNFLQYSTATLYGVTSAAVGAKATGGIISQDANYFYHTFLASGTFTPTSNITADYLVVAGGGGGGVGDNSNQAQGGGGGGAGGLRCTVTATGGGGSLESALSLTASTNYTVTVGAGGASSTSGSNSVFSSITSTGGGAGAGNNTNGSTGGSGGGGGAGTNNNQSGGTGTANQGYNGGNGRNNAKSGGGGGAGQAGENASSITGRGPDNGNGCGGNGGNGVATSISGTSVTYAGGGGGGSLYVGGTGGTGGGGAGGASSTPTAGTANTGGGGGGSAYSAIANGGAGGSGIVIVRYAK
jgi:hypothetical protein